MKFPEFELKISNDKGEFLSKGSTGYIVLVSAITKSMAFGALVTFLIMR